MNKRETKREAYKIAAHMILGAIEGGAVGGETNEEIAKMETCLKEISAALILRGRHLHTSPYVKVLGKDGD